MPACCTPWCAQGCRGSTPCSSAVVHHRRASLIFGPVGVPEACRHGGRSPGGGRGQEWGEGFGGGGRGGGGGGRGGGEREALEESVEGGHAASGGQARALLTPGELTEHPKVVSLRTCQAPNKGDTEERNIHMNGQTQGCTLKKVQSRSGSQRTAHSAQRIVAQHRGRPYLPGLRATKAWRRSRYCRIRRRWRTIHFTSSRSSPSLAPPLAPPLSRQLCQPGLGCQAGSWVPGCIWLPAWPWVPGWPWVPAWPWLPGWRSAANRLAQESRNPSVTRSPKVRSSSNSSALTPPAPLPADVSGGPCAPTAGVSGRGQPRQALGDDPLRVCHMPQHPRHQPSNLPPSLTPSSFSPTPPSCPTAYRQLAL